MTCQFIQIKSPSQFINIVEEHNIAKNPLINTTCSSKTWLVRNEPRDGTESDNL
jgi:hypothetical protein